MEHKRYQHPIIEICRDCSGIGKVAAYHPDDLLHIREPEIKACQTCAGTGRVTVEKVTTITVLPFDKNANHRLNARRQ
jgi:DnaJ-class molecular chaperone